jgi:uncharacterized iron-regulated protein
MYNFKYRSASGIEEVNYMFNEKDYFNSFSIAPFEPLWMFNYHESSQILASNAQFVNRTIDLVSQ